MLQIAPVGASLGVTEGEAAESATGTDPSNKSTRAGYVLIVMSSEEMA